MLILERLLVFILMLCFKIIYQLLHIALHIFSLATIFNIIMYLENVKIQPNILLRVPIKKRFISHNSLYARKF